MKHEERGIQGCSEQSGSEAHSFMFSRAWSNHAFLGRAATVLNGLAAFDACLKRGKRLEAIILTENGRMTEQLLGIVSVHDIPKLRRAIRE